MANTITKTVLNNGAYRRLLYVTVKSDGTQETNTIIYDPTASPYTTSGAYIATKIRSIYSTGSCGGTTGVNAQVYLTWDASTVVAGFSIPIQNDQHYDSMDAFGIPLVNQGGGGVTGKIGITTLGLIAGDTLTIILDIING